MDDAAQYFFDTLFLTVSQTLCRINVIIITGRLTFENFWFHLISRDGIGDSVRQ